MASLKSMAAKNEKPKSKFDAVGVILQVATAEKKETGLVLTGRVLNSNSKVHEGQDVVVEFRGDAERQVTNFVKGNGKKSLDTPTTAATSVLSLEGCYFIDKPESDKPVLSARWLNTIISHQKKADHADRSFYEGSLASAPRVSFPNPDPQPGEPARITLPANASGAGKVTLNVKTDQGTFPKEFPTAWAIEKLKNLGSGAKPQVNINTFDPNQAVVFKNEAELRAALHDQLSVGTKAISMLRVTDGEDVLSRNVFVPFKKEGNEYVPDVDRALEELFKNNLFKGAQNEELFAELASGNFTAEAIAGYQMTYAGDPTKDDNSAYKLVDELKNGDTARYEMIFGKDPNGLAKVILPGVARNDNISGFSPILIIQDEPGTYSPIQFETPNIKPSVAKPTPTPVPLEEQHPSDVAEAFDNEMKQDPLPTPKPDEDEELSAPRPGR